MPINDIENRYFPSPLGREADLSTLRHYVQEEFLKISQSMETARADWRDIMGRITTRGVGATDPTWTQISTGPFYAYAFALDDQQWIAYHIPHDYILGTDIHFHTHWLPSGTNANTVKWQFTYSYAKGFDQEAFSTTGTTVTAEEAGPGVAYQHMVTESAAVTVSPQMETDGILYVNAKRITNGGTNNTDTIYVLEMDVHYRSNSRGTLFKAPNFYEPA